MGALAAVLVSCSGGDTDWQEAESASGTYSAEFPGEPERWMEAIPELGADQEFTVFEADDAAYTITEVPLEPGMDFDLDDSVDGGLLGALGGLEQETGESGDYTEVSRDTGDFEGAETRQAVADFESGDVSAHLRTLIFVREDTLVQALYIGPSSDDEDIDPFFDSFELS